MWELGLRQLWRENFGAAILIKSDTADWRMKQIKHGNCRKEHGYDLWVILKVLK